MTSPVLSGDGTLNDQILAGLESQGYTTGTINDREYQRLLDHTLNTVADGKSINDLYTEAGEPHRIMGDT